MKNIVKICKRFVLRNRNLVLIGAGLLLFILLATTSVYVASNHNDGTTTSNETSATPTLLTPTSVPTVTPSPFPTATKAPLPTATPTITPTPTQVPEDPTKGAIKVKLLNDATRQPLANVSSVNTTIKKGDFSVTKSGAEVYFDNLTAGEVYEVYVDNPQGYQNVGSSCGSDCQLIGQAWYCQRRLPARVPSANQEIQCFYSSTYTP